MNLLFLPVQVENSRLRCLPNLRAGLNLIAEQITGADVSEVEVSQDFA